MIRIIIIAILSVGLLTASVAAPIPNLPADMELVIPTVKGAKWVYNIGDEKLVEVISEVEVKGGATIYTITDEIVDVVKFTPVDKWVVAKNGYFKLVNGGAELEPPLCFLRFPARIGDNWKWETANGKGLTGTAVIRKREWVTVEAGKFRCVRVESMSSDNQTKEPTVFWYASKVGLVKLQDGDYVKELKSITIPAK